MIIALWIIAVCEVIRILQNTLQLMAIHADQAQRDNAYAEFVKSLKSTDKEFVKRMLTEFERLEDPEADWQDIPSELMTLEQARQAVKDLRTSNIHLRMQLNDKEAFEE